MPAPPFQDWRESTPKLWARFTSPKYPNGVYHAFYSLLDEPMPENRGIIPQSVCGLVQEEHVVPEKPDFWPEVGVACCSSPQGKRSPVTRGKSWSTALASLGLVGYARSLST